MQEEIIINEKSLQAVLKRYDELEQENKELSFAIEKCLENAGIECDDEEQAIRSLSSVGSSLYAANMKIEELKQENKQMKKDVQLFKCLDTFGESECHCACRCLGNEFCEDADKKINTYRSALEEIQKAIKIYDLTVDNGASVDTLYTIRKIINEVLNESK